MVAATHASIVGSFVAANLLSGSTGHPATAVSNLAFLSATALIAGVGQVLAFRTQREQFDQRVRLEDATARLERAHADLTRLDQFKSRFFANMTHELRTPIAMVLTPLELLLDGEMGAVNEAQRSSFVTMSRSALKLLKLVNDLLDLSRLEESRLELELADHDLDAYLRGLTEETQVLALRKGIELVYRVDPGAAGAAVHGDLERLERVFVNLLSNAIKFTPPGGHVSLTLLASPEAVEVVVEDDGPGFPPEAAERLFERFYQVDMAGTRQHGGTGIGLALAKEIVLLHGGTIAAAAGAQGGAKLTVRLRRDAAPPGAAGAGPRPGAAGGIPGRTGPCSSQPAGFRLLDIEEAAERRVVERDHDERTRPHTVVVVEDHPQITQFIHMTLRRQFKVIIAPDGQRGLELIERERPDLVVTDLMMPGMDGMAMTRHLRQDPRTRHIPIIMLTARGDLDDRVRGLETGVSLPHQALLAPRAPHRARRLVQAKEEAADLVLTQRIDSLELVAAGLAHELNNPLNYVKNALARVRLDVDRVLALPARPRGRAAGRAERPQLAARRPGPRAPRRGRRRPEADGRHRGAHGPLRPGRLPARARPPRRLGGGAGHGGGGAAGHRPRRGGRARRSSATASWSASPRSSARWSPTCCRTPSRRWRGTGRVRVRPGRGRRQRSPSVKDNGPGIPPEVMSRSSRRSSPPRGRTAAPASG